jgi:CBS domain-containing protein
MRVKEIMTQSAACCGPDTNVGAGSGVDVGPQLRDAANVVGADKKLIGVVTDRDICVALGTRNRLAGELTIGEVVTRNAFACKAEEDIHEALDTMAGKQVRRLPVVNHEGIPQGILSMDDIIAHADLNKWEGRCELSAEEKLYGRNSRSFPPKPPWQPDPII